MNFRRLLPLVPILLSLTGCTRDPAALVRNGNKYFERHKYKEASIMYRRALQKDRRNGEAWYKLGEVDLATGQMADALGSFQRAVQVDPGNTDAAGKLADLYLAASVFSPAGRQQDVTEVKSIAKELLKRNPQSYDGLRLTGFIALIEQHLPDAIAAFEQANQIRPNQPGVVLALCEALSASGKKDEAEKLARDMIARKKDFAGIYDFLARLYFGENRRDDAEQVLKLKVANNPRVGAYQMQLARFYLDTGKPDQMKAVIDHVTGDPTDFPGGWMLVGDFYLYSNVPRHLDEAILAFSRGEAADPRNRVTYEIRRAETLIADHRVPEADVVLADVLRTKPDTPEAIALRSSIDIDSGDKTKVLKAIDAMEPLLGKYQNTPAASMLHLNLGRAYAIKAQFDQKDPDVTKRQRDLDQARIHLEQGLQSSQNPYARFTLAEVLMQQGEYAHAVQLMDAVLNSEPSNLRAHLVRAQALAGMKEYEKERQELERVLQLHPGLVDAIYQTALLDLSQKHYQEAEAGFRKVEQTGDPRGFAGRIQAEVADGQTASVVDELRKRLAAHPNDIQLRMALGNAEALAHNYGGAMTDFQQVLNSLGNESVPLKVDLLLRIGDAQYSLHQNDAALKSYLQARDLAPNNVHPMENIALYYYLNDQKDKARVEYEKVLKVDPDNVQALNNLAYMAADQSTDLDRAMTLVQRASQESPDDPNVKDTLGFVYLRKNLVDESLRISTELVNEYPKMAVFHLHRAFALAQKGDTASAKKELNSAIQDGPSRDDQVEIKKLMAKLG